MSHHDSILPNVVTPNVSDVSRIASQSKSDKDKCPPGGKEIRLANLTDAQLMPYFTTPTAEGTAVIGAADGILYVDGMGACAAFPNPDVELYEGRDGEGPRIYERLIGSRAGDYYWYGGLEPSQWTPGYLFVEGAWYSLRVSRGGTPWSEWLNFQIHIEPPVP